MIAPAKPIYVPDDELKETIMRDTFPQFHQTEKGVFPRVSSVLKLHDLSLHQKLHFGDVDDEFRQRVRIGAIEGNIVHDYIHALLRGDKPRSIEDKSARKKANKFRVWMEEVQPEILLPTDNRIVSAECGYGGTPDLIARIDGSNVVADFKCGGCIHIPNWLQVESYADLVERERDIRIHQIAIVLLGSNSKKPYVRISERRESNRTRFRKLLDEWNGMFPEPFGNFQTDDQMFV